MKAFLLAAGKGTRLRPYTDTQPKCLMPIHGTPLLDIWIDLFEMHGVDRVLINTHHLAGQVEQAVARIMQKRSVEITTFYEPELLGSGGTVLANADFINENEDFLIAYADNLTNIDLTAMVGFHRGRHKAENLLTMGLFRTATPQACGIATLDANNTVTHFEEKPEKPESNLANAGIYVATYNVLEVCREIQQDIRGEVLDLGFHILPRLAGRIHGYEIKETLVDIGTVSAYKRALEMWPPG
jgi:mannose-1-phosphate guanylyltransferase